MEISRTLVCAVLAAALPFAATGARAATFQLVHRFHAGSDGANPQSGLALVGPTLYGTTEYGGAGGQGTLYALDPATGREQVVAGFGGASGADPLPLPLAVGSLLYGTASAGGAGGFGGVFTVDPASRTERLVYSFPGGTGGQRPVGGLTALGGMLYGTTLSGGAGTGCGSAGCGTVFRLDPATGKATVLHRFQGGRDGTFPAATLVPVGGQLYGTTEDGGAFYNGTVFRLDPATGKETVLHAFKGGSDGATVVAGLTPVGSVLYGATWGGGNPTLCGGGCGTIYRLDPATGAETVVYRFHGPDGAVAAATLVWQGGLLYGTTGNGGAHGYGAVFRLDPATGAETVLHSFTGGGDGAYPWGGLAYAGGAFYGTSSEGAPSSASPYGVVFKLTP